MKRFLLSLLVGTGSLCADENPYLKNNPPKGEVSLPLQDWQTVWKAASQQPVPKVEQRAPVTAVVQSASYAARLDGNVLQCDAAFRIRSLTDDWQTLPLAGGEWSLDTSVTLSPNIALIRHEDRIAVMLHGVGDYEVKLPLSLELTDGAAKFAIVPAAAQRFVIAPMADKRVVTLNGRFPLPIAPQELGFSMPSKGGEILVGVEDERPVSAPTLPKPPAPSAWTTDAQVLALFQDGVLHYFARAYLRASKGSGLEATLNLPASAQVAEVTGEDLVTWKEGRSQDGAQRLIRLKWKTTDRLDRRVQFRYELPQSPVAPEWSLVAPESDEPGKVLFAIAPPHGIELSHDAMQGLPGNQASGWIKEIVDAPELLVIEGGSLIKMGAKALPRIDTAKATLKSWTVSTRLQFDGAILHEMNYEFEHRGLFTWRASLPKGVRLLDCKVNGAESSPIQRAPLELEFPLTAKGESTTETKVQLTYLSRGQPWDRVSGSVTLELPKTDVFAQALHWQVELAEGYELTASSEGLTITEAVTPAAPERTVAFKKELFADEAPAVELFYKRAEAAQ